MTKRAQKKVNEEECAQKNTRKKCEPRSWAHEHCCEKFCFHAIIAAVDPDPLGSACIFPPRVGSRTNKYLKKDKCKKICSNCNFIQIFKLHKLHCFLLLSNLLSFFQLQKTLQTKLILNVF